MSDQHDDHQQAVRELIAALRGGQQQRAWGAFLDAYANTIMGVASRFAPNPDHASDCFLHVCEKLCERNFYRLSQFDPSRGATFRTWFTATVSNLCVDWHRSTHGRPVTPAAIQRMSQLDQWAYHFRMEQNLDLESCWRAMKALYPDLDRQQLSATLAAIHQALAPRQRWGLLARRDRTNTKEWVEELAPPNPDGEPTTFARDQEQLSALRAALFRLGAQQRLALRLRFEQDMTLEDVARTIGLADLHQARRLIQAALGELAEEMKAAGFPG